jgi:hypothetical protein
MTGARDTDGKSPDKQRITTFGKILRRTSLQIGSVSVRGIRKVNSLVLLDSHHGWLDFYVPMGRGIHWDFEAPIGICIFFGHDFRCVFRTTRRNTDQNAI